MQQAKTLRRLAVDLTAAVLVPLALARLDGLAARVPSLGLFRGRGAVVLVAGAVLYGLARLLGGRLAGLGARLARLPGVVLFGLALVLYAAVGLHYAAGIQVSGDEPHYLVMAQSIWRDHDLELRDEYEGEEWAEFMPGPLRPHWGAPRADGRPYPAHSPGLPMLLAPAYAMGGRNGCVLLVAFIAAAAALVCQKLALRATGDPDAALVAWLAALGAPLFFYSFHLYTEAPSALAVGFALLILTGSPGVSGAVLAALAASALPWLHLKMVPAAAALGLVAALRLRGSALAAFLIAAGTMAAGFGLYYLSVFGVPTPLAIYGGSLPADAQAFSWRALAGLLVDRSFGLLVIAPIFLLALAGLPRVLRRRETWPVALAGLAVLAPVLTWRMWWGGQCPPARMLVPMLPLLAVAVAVRVALGRDGLVRWWPGLLLVGASLAAVAVADPGARLLLNRGNRPTRLWLALSDGMPLVDYLPSLTHASARDAKVALVWLAALGLLLVCDRLVGSRPRVDGLFRSLLVPVAALLLIGATIDVAIGPPAPAPVTAPESPEPSSP
jgi:hypothetical protein